MFKVLISVFAPLLSLIILVLGNGFFTTLVTLRLNMAGESSWVIGLVSAAYYGGLVIGSFRMEPFIARVGHIRAYATFAALLAVVTLLQGFLLSNVSWIVLRFIGGYCVAGLFVVIESWFLGVSTYNTRGQILSWYMTAFYAAQALGQFILKLSDPLTLVPFCITTILCSLSIIPVSMTYVGSPRIEEPTMLSFYRLYRISPSGVVGSFCGGLILGAIYGLMPLFVSQVWGSVSHVAIIMGITICGGMVLQYPVGRLSDYMERRKVLIALSFLTALWSLILIACGLLSMTLFTIVVFLFGGAAFLIYPLSISHACDQLDPKYIVAMTQGLLLSYSLGAVVGPLIAPGFMGSLGPYGIFLYFSLVSAALGGFIYWRSTKRAAPTVEEQQEFVVAAGKTPIASELDPRMEDPVDAEEEEEREEELLHAESEEEDHEDVASRVTQE